uniref:Uncharacterized protein n=2 Tax=Vitis vinifera TaxID=29760 RepID=F6HHF6_VITVI
MPLSLFHRLQTLRFGRSLSSRFLAARKVRGFFYFSSFSCGTQKGKVTSAMATRIAARYVSRRLSSSGKVLGEEEKAAENIYIKKAEQEKLEKLARKGPKPEEKPVTSSGETVTDANPSGPASSTAGVSTDKHRNYAVLAGTAAILGGLGWYLKSSSKKPEVQD